MEYNEKKSVDMPEFLMALEKQVEVLKQLQEITPDHNQVNDALTRQVKMLKMFIEMQLAKAKFRVKTTMKGKAILKVFKNLFGRDIEIAKRVIEDTKKLGSPDVLKKDIHVVKTLANQIRMLEYLKERLMNKDKIKEVVKEQIKIIKELPGIFPESAPINETLKKRIKLLK
ncbi:MAG TPA: hypothetical protein ENH97_03495 [bacterium]|nr:hypothetical protein [bacterium]